MNKDGVAPSEKFLSGFGISLGGTPAYRRYAQGAQKCYKPTTTRLPFLAGVLLLTCSLIAIVEIVLLQYPVETNFGPLAAPNITRRLAIEGTEGRTVEAGGLLHHLHLKVRVLSTDTIGSSGSFSAADPVTNGIGASIQIIPSTLSFSAQSASTTTSWPYIATVSRPYNTDESAYIPTTNRDGSPSTATYLSLSSYPTKSFDRVQASDYIPPPNTAPSQYMPTTTPGAYLPTTTPQSIATTVTLPNGPPIPIITTFTTTPGAYIPTQTPIPATDSVTSPIDGAETLPTGPGADVSVGPASSGVENQAANIPTSTISGSNAPAISLVPVATQTSGGMAVVVLGTPSETPLVPVSTYTSNGAALVVLGTPSTTPVVPISTYTSNGSAFVVMGTPTEASLIPVSTMTSNGAVVVVLGLPTSPPTTSAILPSGYSVVVEPITSTSGSVVYVYMITMTLDPSQLASQTSTVTAPQNTAATASNEQSSTLEFTNISYFAAWYLPTIVAVAFRVLWTTVYNNARMMEPFYRLASPAGVVGRDALDNLYLSMGSVVPEPILALLSGQSYMLLASSVAYLIELVAPLSSEFLGVDVHSGCIPDASMLKTPHPCPARIVVHLIPARILQGILSLLAILIIFIMFLSRHRPSGVYSDPSSIAVMASLLHHPDILQDFMHLDASDKELEQVVNEQTYRLTHYQAEGEGMKYGIVPTIKFTEQVSGNRGHYTVVTNPEGGVDIRSRHRGLFKRHLFRTIGDISLGILLIGILGTTIGYYLDSGKDEFNVFFNSDTFGPRFILTFAGGIAVSQWKRLEKEVRTLQPYRYLSSSPSSSPLNTLLRATTATPYFTLPLAIARFEPFIALTAFCYILSEILVIMVVTVPYSSNEYWMAFLAGTYITIAILSLQILTFIILTTWWRSTTPSLNHDPDTLKGVWTLLAASSAREDFDDLGTAGREDLIRTVLAWDKRYWLGDVVGKDGVTRIGIHGDEAHEDTKFENHRAQRPLSPLPFSLPPLPAVPKITISSSDIYNDRPFSEN